MFEITEGTRIALSNWLVESKLTSRDYLFPSARSESGHIGTKQYSRLVKEWLEMIGLDPAIYGTHSLRRTKATLIYKETHNLRMVQLLLGHSKIESTVKYLGIEVEDALETSEALAI